MRNFKKVGVLAAVLALGAIGAANASAAAFTNSSPGPLTGKALQTQVFTTNAGQVKCTIAHTEGSMAVSPETSLLVTVKYSGCTAFGFANVHISPASYRLLASGSVVTNNLITITVTGGGCSVSIPSTQIVGNVTYSNASANTIKVSPNLHFIHYKGSGGICGSTTFSNGTYVGDNEIGMLFKGSLQFDP